MIELLEIKEIFDPMWIELERTRNIVAELRVEIKAQARLANKKDENNESLYQTLIIRQKRILQLEKELKVRTGIENKFIEWIENRIKLLKDDINNDHKDTTAKAGEMRLLRKTKENYIIYLEDNK